jgi:hypothetical protein
METPKKLFFKSLQGPKWPGNIWWTGGRSGLENGPRSFLMSTFGRITYHVACDRGSSSIIQWNQQPGKILLDHERRLTYQILASSRTWNDRKNSRHLIRAIPQEFDTLEEGTRSMPSYTWQLPLVAAAFKLHVENRGEQGIKWCSKGGALELLLPHRLPVAVDRSSERTSNSPIYPGPEDVLYLSKILRTFPKVPSLTLPTLFDTRVVLLADEGSLKSFRIRKERRIMGLNLSGNATVRLRFSEERCRLHSSVGVDWRCDSVPIRTYPLRTIMMWSSG